uniref:Uncharacterized protein n=1 Tax=Oncorhynchus kisutch TaxID=8019 RepID=A0A8C7KC15_ONCKI
MGYNVKQCSIESATPCSVLRFPSGVQTRSAVEMVQQHMVETLKRFFTVFSLLQCLQGQGNTVLAVLMPPPQQPPPFSSIGPSPGLGCHVGRPFPAPYSSTPLGSDTLPESGTFGSHLVGNHIQEARDSEPGGGSPILGSLDNWKDSALKQELPRGGFSLQGNWLACWQYEIGLNQQDPYFDFHQIRLQSFLDHLGMAQCLAPLAGEEYFQSGSTDKTVKLWPLYNHGDGTLEVEPSHLEALKEVVSCDATVHLWDQFTGEQICYYEALDGKIAITAVTTMPAPHCSVVFGSADSPPLHRPTPAGTYQTQRKTPLLTPLFSLHPFYSPGGRTVAAGFSSGFIVLLDARTGLMLRHPSVIWPAELCYIMGNLVISLSTDHTLTVWKDLEHKPLHQYNPASITKLSLENFRRTLTSLAVLPTKRLLLLGLENGAIRLLAQGLTYNKLAQLAIDSAVEFC